MCILVFRFEGFVGPAVYSALLVQPFATRAEAQRLHHALALAGATYNHMSKRAVLCLWICERVHGSVNSGI